MYIPSHTCDLLLILIIQTSITNQINNHPIYTSIICKDFNIDIALIGQQNVNKPHHHNLKTTNGKHFTSDLELQYIPIDRGKCQGHLQPSALGNVTCR